MKVFDKIKSKNIDELAEWLDRYGMQDFSPWINWFDKNYCDKCEPVDCGCCKDFGWCEVNGRCKFFQDMDETPYGKELIKLWLESVDDYDGV